MDSFKCVFFVTFILILFLLKIAPGFSLKELATSVNGVRGELAPLAEDKPYVTLAKYLPLQWVTQLTQDDSATELLMELLGKKQSLLTEELMSVGCTSPAGDGHLGHR